MDTIDQMVEARESLLLGIEYSMQRSYQRRAPAFESLSYFERARELLEDVLRRQPQNREALMMMSQVWECLLEYDAAERYLLRALAAGEPRTKRMLKRLSLLREGARIWNGFPLTPEMLRALGKYLEGEGVNEHHRTLDLTRRWLAENGFTDIEQVIQAFGRKRAFSDFQVLANVVRG
jgi:hypothetical protein